VLFIGSTTFGVYKNFTAIDTHTIHEKEIIEKQIIDTNKVESFTEAFANEYFSWQQAQESIDKRNERLKGYLTEDLQQLNADMVRADIPTSSAVRNVQIWNVSEVNDTDFKFYPKATDKELAYYVSNNALPTINKDYVFVELVNPVYAMKDNKVTVIVTVKYLDQETKVMQFSQYELVLEKAENWKIV